MQKTTQGNYVENRDRLIYQAEILAQGKVAELGTSGYETIGADGTPFTWDYFTEFFHKEMKRLTAIHLN